MFDSDIPIKKASEDLLNRTQFAESLAYAIYKYNTPHSFSIGLYGPWGSGKTSLLNLVIEKLEQLDEDTIILRFSPWMCTDAQQLVSQFFTQLASAIKLKRATAEKTADLIGKFGALLKLASFIPTVGSMLNDVGDAISDITKLYKDTNLQQEKNQIKIALEKEPIKIVISIDDIDRLSENEIVAVFQLIKALADFPNTVYLLAFDREIVVKALERVQRGRGEEYLEKVIQVPFEIPSPNINSILSVFTSKLERVLGIIPDEKWDQVIWLELFTYGFKKYVKSLRDVVRYTNVFSLKYQLLKEETDLLDLMGITCLQVFEPAVYSAVSKLKEPLCGMFTYYSFETEKELEGQIKECTSGIIEYAKDKDATRRVLGLLFPKVSIALNLHCATRAYTEKGYLVHKNICISECFDRYYSLSLEDDAIPAALIRHIVFHASEKECTDTIVELYKDGKIIRLIEEIMGLVEDNLPANIPVGRAALLISAFAKIWHTFDIVITGFYFINPDLMFGTMMISLLRYVQEDSRILILDDLFRDERVHLKTLTVLLSILQAQHGRYTERKVTAGDMVLRVEEVITLEKAFTKRASEKLASWSQDPSYDLAFLWKLEQMDPDYVNEKKAKLVNDTASLVGVIKYCTIHGRTATRIVERTWKTDLTKLSQFIDIDEAKRQVDKMITDGTFPSYPKAAQEDVTAFLLSQQAEDKFGDDSILETTIQKKRNEILKDQ